ncbi:protein FAR1-RELATED SEQUENCE 8-like [Cynara cardunculus var. scolymus]|uniref:protein FAR1-RELATED SEQUENCE 8-like n=1 Tax=Cynara cardunculus var. scolymus TaxID=59895 RepID=UPI000D62E853|nr:protein FAR1-RELATED SEQUENCE 8-like [Cynara cardunculus var. scolymus]
MYRGKEIIEDVNQQFNISISYKQALRAKMYALQLLRGTLESPFSLLPVYCHNLKIANPGTMIKTAVDGLGQLNMLFVALGCSIRSFLRHLRPLLIMDGAHLKGTYVGTMFLAVGMNGNNGIVPITIRVGNTESGPSWIWFLHKLRQCIGEVPNLTFLTDRAASIDLVIRNVFPNAHHRFCCRHLSQNLRLTSSKDKMKRWMFWEACKAYRVSDFEATMDLMRHNLPNAAQMTNAMTPWMEAKIEKIIHISANWKVYPISDLLFEVDDRYKKGTCNLHAKGCTWMQ